MGRRRSERGPWEAERWDEPRGPRWVKVGQAQEDEDSIPVGRSRKADAKKGGEYTRIRLQFDDADTAFILGRGGKTKHKIARVSGARLELHERNNTVEVIGSEEACARAKKYISLVQAQRVGPVHVDDSHDEGDLTMMDVPHNCVAFVTGAGGNFLRTCEEEWETLMFFCDYQSPGLTGDRREVHVERLAIFGEPWGRAGAELKIMAAIEAKSPGLGSSFAAAAPKRAHSTLLKCWPAAAAQASRRFRSSMASAISPRRPW